MVAVDNGYVELNNDFGPVEKGVKAQKMPKTGKKLCESHWGEIFLVESNESNGYFNKDVVIKVINLQKWRKKKLGLDKWNDNVAVELDAHRALCRNGFHKNIVELV